MGRSSNFGTPLPGREGLGVGRSEAGVAFDNGPTHPRPLPSREGRNLDQQCASKWPKQSAWSGIPIVRSACQ
ncbi:hypothetical protein EAH76_19025 [Sphingomonas glacialis]|uniref:Uncharacterized protein n=1 Tax=Sphingomonas glacialis TaxID=658225 RepID=A0A502FJL6_9SPHN|nr:hypothetical protein EAH76_19025 [Sphingomonas glacialis]